MITRLEYLLQERSSTIHYPQDVARLKEEIPELRGLSDAQVQRLYSDWCEDSYCASWLILDQDSIVRFAEYLRDSVSSEEAGELLDT